MGAGIVGGFAIPHYWTGTLRAARDSAREDTLGFQLATEPGILWDLYCTSEFAGTPEITFGYLESILYGSVSESDLCVFRRGIAGWEALDTVVDEGGNTLTVESEVTALFALGVRSRVAVLDQQPPAALSMAVAPNPFNAVIEVIYDGVRVGQTLISVYDCMGRQVRKLIGESGADGSGRVIWDGRDDGGRRVASGVYLVRMTVGGQSVWRKAVLVR
jgi:hypothetical protein